MNPGLTLQIKIISYNDQHATRHSHCFDWLGDWTPTVLLADAMMLMVGSSPRSARHPTMLGPLGLTTNKLIHWFYMYSADMHDLLCADMRIVNKLHVFESDTSSSRRSLRSNECIVLMGNKIVQFWSCSCRIRFYSSTTFSHTQVPIRWGTP